MEPPVFTRSVSGAPIRTVVSSATTSTVAVTIKYAKNGHPLNRLGEKNGEGAEPYSSHVGLVSVSSPIGFGLRLADVRRTDTTYVTPGR